MRRGCQGKSTRRRVRVHRYCRLDDAPLCARWRIVTGAVLSSVRQIDRALPAPLRMPCRSTPLAANRHLRRAVVPERNAGHCTCIKVHLSRGLLCQTGVRAVASNRPLTHYCMSSPARSRLRSRGRRICGFRRVRCSGASTVGSTSGCPVPTGHRSCTRRRSRTAFCGGWGNGTQQRHGPGSTRSPPRCRGAPLPLRTWPPLQQTSRQASISRTACWPSRRPSRGDPSQAICSSSRSGPQQLSILWMSKWRWGTAC